jgi:two-component system phosphate regulon sensor histidine kinase PhoR
MNNTFLLLITAASLLVCAFLAVRLRAARGPRSVVSREPDPTELLGTTSSATEILERMNEGVLLVDRSLKPRFANAAARRLLGLQMSELPFRLPSVEVGDVATRALATKEPTEELVETYFPERLFLKIEAAPIEGGEDALIVVQDVSEEVRIQRVRREFVAHASHELKSPVASMQTLAEAVSGAVEQGDAETAQRFSAKLLVELDRLGKLVSDLLDLSRLEDPARLPEEPCDVAAVARAEIEQTETTVRSSMLGFEFFIDEELWVKGDPQQLTLLLRNLLENAVQYTPEGGKVMVDVKGAGSWAVIRVSDDGIGIPLEAQSRIFERFYRADRARSRDRGGTGLGLAIVKHITELHGGTVEVQSELGHGSTFTVRIPLLESVRKAKETA